MFNHILQDYISHIEQNKLDKWLKMVNTLGFSFTYNWIQAIDQGIEKADSIHLLEDINNLVMIGKRLVPDLEKISPVWQSVWDDFQQIIFTKKKLYSEIVEGDRDGNWQILIDNKFITEGIACHTNLSFARASYLYAKFSLQAKKNEIIQLQKVKIYVKSF